MFLFLSFLCLFVKITLDLGLMPERDLPLSSAWRLGGFPWGPLAPKKGPLQSPQHFLLKFS